MLRHVSIGLLGLAATFLSAGDLFAQGSGFSGAALGGGGGGGGASGGGFGSTGLGSSMGGTSSGGGLTMMYAATLSGGFGVLGFGGANGFGSSTSMYGGRAYGSTTTAGGGTGMGSGMNGGGGGGGGGGGSRPTTSYSGGGGANAGGGRNRGGRTGANTPTTNAQDAWFEPRIEIGFEVPETKKSAVAKTVADSMGANKPGTRFGGVQVSMAGSVAILRGTVASLNDRQLAEQIAMLDPSVTSVRNELTVTPAPKKKVVSQ